MFQIDVHMQTLTKNSNISENLEKSKIHQKIHQHDPERFKLIAKINIWKKNKLEKKVLNAEKN